MRGITVVSISCWSGSKHSTLNASVGRVLAFLNPNKSFEEEPAGALVYPADMYGALDP